LVQRALEANAELRFTEAEVAAARGQRTQAGLWQNPELSGEYGERRVRDAGGALAEDGFTRSASITQTFEFPGKGSLRKAIANKDVELAELGLRQFRWTLEGQVRRLALTYINASANAQTTEEIAERGSALTSLLKERPAAGTQALLEMRVIEGNLLELQKAAQEAVLARDEARIGLNALLGWPASQPLNLVETPRPPSDALPPLDALVLRGLSSNLQLKARTVELEKAVRTVSAARLDIAPDFSIGPFFSQERAGEDETGYGVTLSTTLPLWNWNQGNIATAQARRAQADALLLDARRKVEAEIARRHRAYQVHLRLVQQAPAATVEALREAADLADRNYRTGAIALPLYLEVQREYLNARRLRGDALLAAWESWLDLRLLTGGWETNSKEAP
jgi:cobalt-zinc-cadmium efflux system outer membrane protein